MQSSGNTTLRLCHAVLIGLVLSQALLSQAITLQAASELPLGSVVSIEEALIINRVDMTIGSQMFQLRDDTRAVSVYLQDPDSIQAFLGDADVGDVISLTANTNSYLGLFESVTPSAPAAVVPSPTIDLSVDPVLVGVDDFLAFSTTAEQLESQYVFLEDIILRKIRPGAPGQTPFDDLFPYETNIVDEPFLERTTYAAVYPDGSSVAVWARSAESVATLNEAFGDRVPSGPFDLTGIFTQAFDQDDPAPGEPGVNYMLNPVIHPALIIPEPGVLGLFVLCCLMSSRTTLHCVGGM